MSKRPAAAGGSWKDSIDPPESFADGDNVGVRLGAPSGGLVDIDLDCPEAVALAPAFLPPTATFGRTSKPRSHWLYKVVDLSTDKSRKPSRSSVEFRSTGGQTVFPGSTHETGEPIEWTPDGAPVTEITEAELLARFGRLAAASVIAQAWPDVQARHDAHHAVLALAGALWHNGWAQDDATALLLAATEVGGGCDPGHREQAIADTWGDHDRGRWGWPKVAEFLGPVEQKAIERVLELCGVVPRLSVSEIGPLTDAGNAERFLAWYGSDVRHVKGLGWLTWDGVRWSPLSRDPMLAALHTIRATGRWAIEHGDATAAKWAHQSESAAKLRACVDVAEALDQRTDVDHLDADPMILNTPSGTVDLRTGEQRPHTREDLITRCTGVPFDPYAECPRFARFLGEVFGNDHQVIAYVLRFLGYSLTGLVHEQVFGLWHGSGSNGKSTLIELLQHILGDYACKLPREMLTASKLSGGAENASPMLVRLRGVRLACGTEEDAGKRWNEALVKELTGGDTIVARKLYADPVQFDPTWKIVLAVNHKPTVRGTDYGIWRRIHLVPFEQRFEGSRKDPTLPYQLEQEAPGVLGLLVRACASWVQTGGLHPPAKVSGAVESYQREHDVIGEFLAEVVEPDPSANTRRADMWKAYRQWSTEGAEYLHKKSAFNRILEDRGLALVYEQGHWVWKGVRIKGAIF